jgi:hypothetical protein
MAERTTNDPLSGAEIKEIILNKIERSMNGDSTLNDDLAYAGFTARYEVRVSYVRSLTKETLVWGAVNDLPSGDIVEPTGETVIADTYVAPAPNVARQQNNLPIPVLIQTPTGTQRKRVQIEKAK